MMPIKLTSNISRNRSFNWDLFNFF